NALLHLVWANRRRRRHGCCLEQNSECRGEHAGRRAQSFQRPHRDGDGLQVRLVENVAPRDVTTARAFLCRRGAFGPGARLENRSRGRSLRTIERSRLQADHRFPGIRRHHHPRLCTGIHPGGSIYRVHDTAAAAGTGERMAPLNGMNGGASIRISVKRKIFPAVGNREAQVVLSDVSFEVAPRSFLVITGPSGCGKSTLLNIIAGLDTDYDGDVDLGPARDRLAFIFQTPRLLPWRTVYENIALVLPSGDPRRAEIPAMIERVGLAEAANAYPERLSLGMQRRAALARGFILQPEILLMDEPFVSLDDPT